MFSKFKSKATSTIDTLVGAKTRIVGDIYFTGGLRVDGTVHGDVTEEGEAASALIVSEQGSIQGSVRVSQLVLNGRIVGPVHVDDYVELQSKARVIGDVYYRSIEMHTGAVIEGNLVYQGEAPEIKLLTNKD